MKITVRGSRSRWLDTRHARGFSIVAAIAILVILASLGTFILSISGGQHRGLALDLIGSRAYQAARSGIEWSGHQIFSPEAASTTPYNCAVPTTTISGMDGTLAGFTVTVTCSMTTHTEFGNTIRVFQVVANACNDPGGGTCPNNSSSNPAYVERQITAVFGTCRDAPTDGTSC